MNGLLILSFATTIYLGINYPQPWQYWIQNETTAHILLKNLQVVALDLNWLRPIV
ncbi:hypothetical protein D3C87_1850360 [compost metagenome]